MYRLGRYEMIKNERQYRITKTQANGFVLTLQSLRENRGHEEGVHPLIVKAHEEAVSSQLADLESEMREYESLKSGDFQFDELTAVTQIPAVLIKARIAQGLSQKNLADRIGVKEQQIQRYEATDYASASLSRIREVASALADSPGEYDAS